MSILFFLSACQQKDINGQAVAYCDCIQPVLNINEAMISLMEQEDREGFMKLAKKAGEMDQEAKICCKKAKETYQVNNQSDLKAALKKQCPDAPERLLNELVDL